MIFKYCSTGPDLFVEHNFKNFNDMIKTNSTIPYPVKKLLSGNHNNHNRLKHYFEIFLHKIKEVNKI